MTADADRPPLDIRPFDLERDRVAVTRIWREVRWIEDGEDHEKLMGEFLSVGSGEVGMVDGEAECFVHRTPGSLTYDRTDLDLVAITGVTTSPIGRKQGLASAMTARAVRHAAESGAAMTALGMFEQGFYDRFGFGTAGPDHFTSFDPAALLVDHVPYRRPVRIGKDNSAEMADAIRRRHRHHGAVCIWEPGFVQAEVSWAEEPFGLGYRNDEGQLTHFVFGELKEENGPWRIRYLIFETLPQLMELLRLMKELGDQLHSIRLPEPAEFALQTLLGTPNRESNRTRKAELESGTRAFTWYQLRILDLPPVIAARHWTGTPVQFIADLSDPVTEQLRRAGVTDGWTGLGGRYRISVGAPSTIEPLGAAIDAGDTDDTDAGDLPVVSASIGHFSRLWFGVESASALVALGQIDAPADLCDQLDDALRLPSTNSTFPF